MFFKFHFHTKSTTFDVLTKPVSWSIVRLKNSFHSLEVKTILK